MCQHHHFEFLLLGYGAYLTFFAFCKKAFPEITDQTIARMVAGMEAEIFRPDDELRRLARRAVELSESMQNSNSGCRPKTFSRHYNSLASRGAPGWKRLETSRHPWFNINVGDGFYHYHRAWNDDLSMPFACLPEYIRRVKSGDSLERPIERLQAERQELIEGYRDLLGTDEERAAYDQMITLAHRVFPYVEGHKFYCEHWYTNLFFNKIREFGALLAAHGFFPGRRGCVPSDPLRVGTRHHRSHDRMVEWLGASRAGAFGPTSWPSGALRWLNGPKHETPPALGPVPDVIDDPAIVMLWGITRENLDAWLTADGAGRMATR